MVNSDKKSDAGQRTSIT